MQCTDTSGPSSQWCLLSEAAPQQPFSVPLTPCQVSTKMDDLVAQLDGAQTCSTQVLAGTIRELQETATGIQTGSVGLQVTLAHGREGLHWSRVSYMPASLCMRDVNTGISRSSKDIST